MTRLARRSAILGRAKPEDLVVYDDWLPAFAGMTAEYAENADVYGL